MNESVVISSGATALVCSIILQALKNSPSFPWLGVTKVHERANFWVSVLVASAATVGIDTKWDPQAHSLLLTGLTAANLWHWLAHGIAQWATQHALYKTVVVQPELMGQLITGLTEQAKRGGEPVTLIPNPKPAMKE